jgi:serine/threonine protein kinase
MHPEVNACDDPSHTRRCPQSRIGEYVGLNYRIVRHLASGGMAEVYLAEHASDDRAAAVKFMAFDGGASINLLRHEAAILAQLRHPNIQRFIEHGHAGHAGEYLLTEYIRGVDLDDWLLCPGALVSPARTLALLQQLSAALDHLHAQGIVHGDLKPANVMVDPNAGDTVTLIDFGLAFDSSRPSLRPAGVGTPGYMAPEQLRGGSCGPAIDRYALGAVGFELLTGQPLQPDAPSWYPGQSARVYTRRSLERSLSCRRLNAVFARALHVEPAERYASATEFVAALGQALANPVTSARYGGCALSA